MKKMAFRFLAWGVGMTLAGIACNFLSQSPLSTLGSSYTDPCSIKPDLGLNLEAAASALTMTSKDGAPTFEPLGIDGAQRLADEIIPDDTLCSLTVSTTTQTVLDHADQLLRDGKTEEAQTLLEDWLADQKKPNSGGALYMVAQGTVDSDRQIIHDILRAAGEVASVGGDPQPFLDYAIELFRLMAVREIQDASLEEIMRIAEEAILLGQDDIAEEALQRARDILAGILDEAIAGFDPCITQNDDLSELLKTLEQAILLGVEGTLGPGDARYDAVLQHVEKFVKLRLGSNPWPPTIPEYEGPEPSCAIAELEFRVVMPPGCDNQLEIPLIPLQFIIPPAEPEDDEELYFSTEEKAIYNVEGKGSVTGKIVCPPLAEFSFDEIITIEGTLEGISPNRILRLRLKVSGQSGFDAPLIELGADENSAIELEFPLVDGAMQVRGGDEFILHLIK